MCCPCPPAATACWTRRTGRPCSSGKFCCRTASFDPLDNELQNIYACLAQPTDRLTVSWPVGDVNGSQLRPSFVVQRMEKLFPRLHVTREDGSYRRRLPATALELAGEDPALRQYFRGRGDYDRVLDAMDRGRALGRGRLSGPAVEALYGRSLHMSASRMDQVKRCHFGYFMQYGLRAKDRRRRVRGPGDRHVYPLSAGKRGPGGQDPGRLGPRCSSRSCGSWSGNIRTATPGRRSTDIRRKAPGSGISFPGCGRRPMPLWRTWPGSWPSRTFPRWPLSWASAERTGSAAVTITEGDQRLSVSGKVDRVDGWLHDGRLYLRVVDYKTGKKSFDLSDLRYGLGIQMLLYLFTLEQEGRSYFGYPIVPAGVLYHPAREVILKADRGIQPEKLQLALQSALRRSGMVLSDPQVLRAMEHSAWNRPITCPSKVKKDGSIRRRRRLGGAAGQAGPLCGAACCTRSPGRSAPAASTPTRWPTAPRTGPASTATLPPPAGSRRAGAATGCGTSEA